MIVRCIRRKLADLNDEARAHCRQSVHLEEVDLEIGREFLAYGVILRQDYLWFLVCEETNDQYPKPHFGGFFELVDARVPPGWSLAIENENAGPIAFLPDPWASDSAFLEALVDGLPEATATFREIKERLEQWHSVNPIG